MESRYKIRPMVGEEIALAVEWAGLEGWNPGLHDAACYGLADPNGFLVGLLDDEPIACISVVRYGTFGFLGFYIVKPGYRGNGYGYEIWKAGMAYLEGCTIGLDGVVAQQDNYRKSGFELAYRNVRYQSKAVHSPEVAGVTALADVPFSEVDRYDRPFFPAARPAFIEAWIAQPDSHALGILRDDELVGYGVIRRCQAGCKIGPLFADSADLAEQLYRALLNQVDVGTDVYLDVPEVNVEAVALAKRYDMRVVFETARMYAGPAPTLPLNRTFGVASFEIG